MIHDSLSFHVFYSPSKYGQKIITQYAFMPWIPLWSVYKNSWFIVFPHFNSFSQWNENSKMLQMTLTKKHRFPTYLLGGKERNVSWLTDWGGSAFATVIWPRCATRTSGLFSDSGMTTTGVSNITSRLKGWQRLVGLLQRDLFTSDQKPYWWTSRIQ